MRVSPDDLQAVLDAHLRECFLGRELTEATRAAVAAEIIAIGPLIVAAASDEEPTAA